MRNKNLYTRRFSTKSFTLIELLVVIAIISILASILLPSLGTARARAYTMQCLNQMKQMSMGQLAYASQNNDVYGYGNMNTNPYTGWRWTGNTEFQELAGIKADPYYTAHWRNAYVCKFARQGTWPVHKFSWDAYGINYNKKNVLDASGTTIATYHKLTQIKSPSAQIAIMEVVADTQTPYYSSGLWTNKLWRTYGNDYEPYGAYGNYIAYRHNNDNGTNAIFFDGHVSTLTSSTFSSISSADQHNPYK